MMVAKARVGGVRRLPFVPLPCEGESFGSWLDRVADEFSWARLETVSLLGLGRTQTDLSLVLRDEQVETVSAATGLAVEQIAGMLLTRYTGTALPPLEFNAGGNLFGWWLTKAWVRNGGSYVCLRCLEEPLSPWRLSWKLPWVTACLKHGVYLTGFCRTCRRPLSMGSGTHSRLQCGAKMPPCRADLRAMQAVEVRNERLLQIAADLAELMEATGETAEQARVTFDELRSLIQLGLYLGTPEMLGDADHAVASGFARFCRVRDGFAAARPRQRHKIEEHNEQYLDLMLRPPGPLLMSAALLITMPLLRASNVNEACRNLFAQAGGGPVACYRWTQLTGYSVYLNSIGHPPTWKPPARFAQALEEASAVVGMDSQEYLAWRRRPSRPPAPKLAQGVSLASVGEGLPYTTNRLGRAQ